MELWIAYMETGEYSDYSMGILGVFDNPVTPMALIVERRRARWWAGTEEAAVKRWRPPVWYPILWRFEAGSWHGKGVGADLYSEAPSWTVEPRTLNALER